MVGRVFQVQGIVARILGLDPGLNRTGWGVIDSPGSTCSVSGQGVIAPRASCPLPERLATLFRGLDAVIQDCRPDVVAVEETFLNRNAASSLTLGLARGVVLLVPGLHDIPVFEYAANTVKKTVTGYGHATKDQVALMVNALLRNARVRAGDSADALAIALCHAHHHPERTFPGGRKP